MFGQVHEPKRSVLHANAGDSFAGVVCFTREHPCPRAALREVAHACRIFGDAPLIGAGVFMIPRKNKLPHLRTMRLKLAVKGEVAVCAAVEGGSGGA